MLLRLKMQYCTQPVGALQAAYCNHLCCYCRCSTACWCCWRGWASLSSWPLPSSFSSTSASHGAGTGMGTGRCMELKGSVSQDFRPPIFHDSDPTMPLINRLMCFRTRFRFRRDIRSQSLKNLTPPCAWPRSQIFRLSKSKIVLIIFSFMLDVLTPKRISPDSLR